MTPEERQYLDRLERIYDKFKIVLDDMKSAGIVPLYNCKTAADFGRHVRNAMITGKARHARLAVIKKQLQEVAAQTKCTDLIHMLNRWEDS